jgi:hypothetical protein
VLREVSQLLLQAKRINLSEKVRLIRSVAPRNAFLDELSRSYRRQQQVCSKGMAQFLIMGEERRRRASFKKEQCPRAGVRSVDITAA